MHKNNQLNSQSIYPKNTYLPLEEQQINFRTLASKNSLCSPLNKKINLKSLKTDAFSSLNDVECFLNKFTSSLKYIKLIKLLK